jgi:hypothetical protein
MVTLIFQAVLELLLFQNVKMGQKPKNTQTSWVLVWKHVFRLVELKKNLKNEGNRWNGLCVGVFFVSLLTLQVFFYKWTWNFTLLTI